MPSVGVLTGGGEAWSSGSIVGRGARRRSRMESPIQTIPCPVEDGYGFLVGWIGERCEEVVAGWL